MITLKKLSLQIAIDTTGEKLSKIFLEASYVRYKLDADKNIEAIESNPLLRNFFVAGQSPYGHMMNTAMKTFASKDKKITGADIRGVNDIRPKVLMENPNSYALFFGDYYKYNNKNPKQGILIIRLDLVKKTPLLRV